MMSPPPPKVCFSWGKNFAGKIYRGIVLHGETNDHIIPRGKEFSLGKGTIY